MLFRSYDIHSVVTRLGVTPDWEFLRATFGAKQVPLELLLQIRSQALLHAPDWPSVKDTVREPIESFDFYVDFVSSLAEILYQRGMVHPPA